MHRRSKRILTGLGIVLVALALAYAILLLRATAQLRQACVALATDGRPLRSAEILGPKVADANNAAVLYRSAILLLKGEPAGDKSLYEQLTGRTWERLGEDQRKQFIGQEAVANALALVEQGTRRPACQLEHDYGDSLHAYQAPVIENMRNIVGIMGARCRWEVQAGRPARAWDLVLTLLRFGDSLRFDPIYDTQFVRLRAIRGACRTIQWLCETAPPDPEHVQAIEDLLKRQDDISLMVRAVDAERLFIGEWFFRQPKEELDKILWKEKEQDRNKIAPPGVLKFNHRLSFLVLAFQPRLIADHAAYLQLMRKRVQLFQGPYRDRKELPELLRPSLWNILTDKLNIANSLDKEFYCGDMATLRLTRAGLALLQYKQAHGVLPPTLDALGVAGLVDPFTEEPLHYRPEGEGFLVYSVGPDRKDNGGTPRPEYQDADPRRKPVDYDIVWRFPNPENRDKPK
ncbi:MAG: hypothetical protein M1376_09535 [Planctomycetes bacterium]|nr:hypothetical protein [Planctomycetota bacterium]